MILELSLEKAETASLLDSIALNSDFPRTLSGQRTYECFLPARIDFQAPAHKFEIERTALVVILSRNTSRILYPFDVCRFHAESLGEFGDILMSYNFKSFVFLDKRHENVFSNAAGRRLSYIEAGSFNSYMALCREKDAIYPIFTCFDRRE
jgi:hypothetical protein